MLPDLPATREHVSKALREFFKRTARAQTGVWQKLDRHIADYECSGFEQHRFDGSVDLQDYKSVAGTIRLDLRDLKREGFAAVVRAYREAATEFGQRMAKLHWGRFDEIIEESGQSFDAGGKPLTPDLFLDLLENVDLDFDTEGNPCFPTFITTPSLLDTVRGWTITNEQQHEFEQLVERKRLAWRDRESDRRLVD